MAVLRRQILNIPLGELADVDKTFGKMTSLDIEAVPEQFLEIFADTRRIAYRHYTISSVFQSFPIQGAYNGSIMLANGSLVNVGDVSQLFADSFELGFFVASLKDQFEAVGQSDVVGRSEAARQAEAITTDQSMATGPAETTKQPKDADEMLKTLFMDSWATALIGSGEKWLVDFIRKKVIDQSFHMTNPFGPGQGNIPLEMQALLLENLQASEIGVSLNSHFVMTPIKTVTGIFGIQKNELVDSLKPCDICDLSETCPTAYA